jgi:hypothetical protein
MDQRLTRALRDPETPPDELVGLYLRAGAAVPDIPADICLAALDQLKEYSKGLERDWHRTANSDTLEEWRRARKLVKRGQKYAKKLKQKNCPHRLVTKVDRSYYCDKGKCGACKVLMIQDHDNKWSVYEKSHTPY